MSQNEHEPVRAVGETGRGFVRPLTSLHFSAWQRLQQSSYGAFPHPQPWQVEERLKDTDDCQGLFIDDRLVAGLHLLPMTVYYGERPVSCGGIASVACSPDSRRQGHAFTLLKATISLMKERGYAVSALYPFAFPFYRRLGWEHAADLVAYEVPLSDLPLPGGGPAENPGRVSLVARCLPGEREEVEDGVIARLDSVYRSYAPRFNGLRERDEAHWRRFLLRTRQLLKHTALWEDAAGQPGGYVIYLMPVFGQEPADIQVRELVATSDAAYRGLLGFLRNQEALYKNLKVSLPPSDPLPLYLPNPRVRRELRAHYMLRLVDVPAALEAAAEAPEGMSGSVIIAVDDPVAARNSGEWLMEAEAGQVRVTRAGSNGRAAAHGRVEVGVGVLAQIISGFIPAASALQTGRLAAASPGAVGFLDTVFGRRPAHLSDYF